VARIQNEQNAVNAIYKVIQKYPVLAIRKFFPYIKHNSCVSCYTVTCLAGIHLSKTYTKIERYDESSYVAVVDDIDLNRKILANLCTKMEEIEHVRTFSSAESALEDFARQPPDLIITDFSMPNMDATIFLKKIRKHAELEETPVIVVSAYEKTENRRSALSCGATDFLTTPLDVFEFRLKVHNLLRLGLHQKILRLNGLSLKQKLTTTRMRAIKERQAASQRFTNVIDSVPALIFATNKRGECVFSNEYCFDLLGDFSFRHLINQLGTEKIGSSEPIEINVRNPKGEDYTFFIKSHQLPSSPKHEGVVIYTGIDVSTLKRTEQSLRIAKLQAEAASRAKSAFVANMSHEIRTPLNAIIGFADLIYSQTFGPVQNDRYTDYIKDILSSAGHLLSLIDEILDFAQIEQGQHVIQTTDFSLLDCIGGCGRMLQFELESKRNKLVIGSTNDFILSSDHQKLLQVLVNIVKNANNVMSEGLIRIDIHQNQNSEIKISVKDHGIGMSEGEVGIALSKFGRVAHPELASSDSGVGLGLPISAAFMKLLGGKLEISSKKGTGTRVDLVLPPSSLLTVKPAPLNIPPVLANHP
jgi:two-component system, cell cycle sensor histidine kinase PleC